MLTKLVQSHDTWPVHESPIIPWTKITLPTIIIIIHDNHHHYNHNHETWPVRPYFHDCSIKVPLPPVGHEHNTTRLFIIQLQYNYKY